MCSSDLKTGIPSTGPVRIQTEPGIRHSSPCHPNKFQDETAPKQPGETFRGSNQEEEEKQCARLRDLKRRRDNREVTRRLKDVEAGARRGENLVLPILDAVKVYATVGEVCDTLREVWGEWQARPSLEM